ncbi:phosphoribosylamine--glycine ligase [Leptospira sp. severe_002]|uniref:phosphoribosylamine--glycine ligase n=1 Tax=Leptospira sp. severe_002 TaxID=2838237 RepID=UPI001E2DF685|nr:phosphoribosylamine--glycine ligase [Leptospira sp. severe_002]
MNILLLGSGGREHALAWKIAASPLTDKLYCAPGNAGIAQEAELVGLDITDHAAVIAFCKEKTIDFVVVGPEAPLVAGIVDDLEAAGFKTFGPTKNAAQLEGSKGFTKDLCRANNIPTGAYERFSDIQSAMHYVRQQGAPIVIKADGLAAGKGVVVAMTLAEAEAAVDMMFSGGMGAAGAEVVVEEFLQGEEASFFALCDGENAIALASAQDHKRVGDGDTGPNTGGMGAYSPAPVMTDEITKRTMDEIILPTVRAMKAMGAPYKGVLFAGLMITKDGPKLIEYNARFGDPETQVLMLRLMSDFLPALIAARDGQLKNFDLRWYPDAALTVVMAAKGYPGDYKRGTTIEGLYDASQVEGVEIFHAGTKQDGQKITANGGRVLNVSALGKNVTQAQARAYQAVDRIQWPEGFCRRDIGWQAVAREKGK